MGNRKEEILIVALHLFARDGYEAVSVSQIAGELDMTKGVYCRIKIPTIAEGNPESCMRIFPIIADAFGISLRPQQML